MTAPVRGMLNIDTNAVVGHRQTLQNSRELAHFVIQDDTEASAAGQRRAVAALKEATKGGGRDWSRSPLAARLIDSMFGGGYPIDNPQWQLDPTCLACWMFCASRPVVFAFFVFENHKLRRARDGFPTLATQPVTGARGRERQQERYPRVLAT